VLTDQACLDRRDGNLIVRESVVSETIAQTSGESLDWERWRMSDWRVFASGLAQWFQPDQCPFASDSGLTRQTVVNLPPS